jgi:hypothetical protein
VASSRPVCAARSPHARVSHCPSRPSPRPQYAAANASGNTYKASSVTGIVSPLTRSGGLSLGDAMAFAGPGPELINGRLAMLAFVAALGAEATGHVTVLRQLACQPTGVALLFVLIAAGSLVTLVEGLERPKNGFFNAAAEQLNGRAAMIGFASLLVTEKLSGHALL